MTKRHAGGILLATVLLSFAFLVPKAFATEDRLVGGEINVVAGVEAVLRISLPDDITIRIDPGNKEAYTVPIYLDIYSNNPTGYFSYISTNKNRASSEDTSASALVHKENSDYQINSLTSSTTLKEFPTGYWGYSVDGGKTFDGVPAANETPADAYTDAGLYFGVKVPEFQAAGRYSSTIVVTAVTRHVQTPEELFDGIEYMQDMTQQICETENAGISKQLIDRRDGKTYWVTKMRDNNCWMTQNLDFEISSNGTTLTAADSNVFATRTITKESAGSGNNIFYADLGDYYIPNGDGYDDDGKAASTLDLDPDSLDWHYQVGSIYSWSAATAGSGNEKVTLSEADESICPKGWRLPVHEGAVNQYRNYTFLKLFDRQPETWRAGDYITSYTIDSIGEAPFYFIDARKVALPEGYDYAMMPFLPDSSSSIRDKYLMFTYWTSTAYPASHNLSGSSYVWYWNDSNGKNAALPYIANDYASSARPDYRYIFGNTTFSNSSNPLVSRNTNSFVRCVAAKKDLYSISTMQEITDEIIRNTDVEASKMLTDTRDGKKYWVTKELDGNIWMTQNLDFDISTEGTQLSPLTSDVLSDKTLTAVSPYGSDSLGVYYIDEGNYYYSDTYSTGGTDFAESDNGQSVQTHFHVGNSYSWNAATAGSGALTTAGNDAAESICPKGWHLPTNETNYLTNFNNNSSFQTLYTTLFAKGMDRAENVRYEGYYYSITNPISYPPLYFHMTGSYSPGGTKNSSSESSYWTSKLANISGSSYNAYEFVLNYSNLYDSNIYSMKDRTMYGAFGLKVRCVARSVEDYTMNYDANGGSNAPLGESGITSTREHSITVTSEVPTRYGFKFIGWATAPDKLEAEYQAGDTFTFSSNSATLYAVWETTLQAFKCSWLDTVGSAVKAIDVRDNMSYTVKKLADEQCWTIENLRLDLSDLDEDISPENTNNPTEEFMNAVNTSPRPSSSNDWCTSYGSEECYNQIQYNSDNVGDFNFTPTTQGGDGNPYDSYGVYYNWYTAVAGNEVYDQSRPTGTTYNNGFIAGDICPYGWHMPSTQDYATLNNLYTGTSRRDVIMNSGYYVGTSYNARGNSSFYWTIGYDVSYGLASWNNSSSWPWYEGSTVKCVADKEDQFHISYSANGGSNAPTDSYVIKSTSSRATFTLSYRVPTRAGYTFEGWSPEQNATFGKYQPGQTITVFTPVTKLYAIWSISFQSFNCSELTNIGDQAVVKDSRNGKNYSVAKLADGHCWMTEDLSLGFSSSNLLEDISPENTNNPTQAFMDAANARPSYTYTWCNDNSSSGCLDNLTYYYTTSYYSDRPSVENYYYNWYTATAGHGTYAKSGGHTDGDICPAGWHLPTGTGFGELGVLSKALGGRYDSETGEAWAMWDSTSPTGATMSGVFRSAPNNFVLKGYKYSSSTYGSGSYGYYWTSTVYNNGNAYNLDMNTSYLAPGTSWVPKYYGYGVRCIADYQKDYAIVFNVNGGTGAPANQVVTSGKGRATVTIPDTIPTREGFTFRGWGTERYMSAPEYQPGNEIILMAPSPTLTLYAVWEATTSLQNFSCSSLLPNVGDVAVARDVRDNQYYGVTKLADGNCWLAEDLRLDLNYLQESISSENTNNPSSTFITQVNAGATSDWNAWDWCTDQTAACYDKIQYLMYTSSYSKKYAGFYNWYTATAGSRLYSNGSGKATGDICPYGWHLPTGNNSGEFGKLSNALGGYQSNGTPQFMDYSTSPTGATMNAILKANSFYNNTYHYGSSHYINMSAYWSSTAYNNSRSRALFINTDRVAPGIYYANDKFYGFTIRCLKSN